MKASLIFLALGVAAFMSACRNENSNSSVKADTTNVYNVLSLDKFDLVGIQSDAWGDNSLYFNRELIDGDTISLPTSAKVDIYIPGLDIVSTDDKMSLTRTDTGTSESGICWDTGSEFGPMCEIKTVLTGGDYELKTHHVDSLNDISRAATFTVELSQ
jgi:hypothetical protein